MNDSINGGVCIPKNLKECFQELDKFLPVEDREEIKALPNRDEMTKYHFSLGLWIRNNWGLWSGSRLQQLMAKKGIIHPDTMSKTILSFYHDWLNDKNDDWENWSK